MQWTITVHGGAGIADRSALPPDATAVRHAGLHAALHAARSALSSPHTPPASDDAPHVLAAVAAVAELERRPEFNAGVGAVLATDGSVELEASVMNGASMRTGAVAGLRTVTRPVRAAHAVLRGAPYQFLGFAAAEAFAAGAGLEVVENGVFVTDARRRDLERRVSGKDCARIERTGETVGAVVWCDGAVACATSTGGVSGKVPGRIGDTPMIGAGSYACGVGGVSGTGVGEEFIRWNAAGRACAIAEYGGVGLGEGVRRVVRECLPEGCGGFVGVDARGGVVMECNSVYMARGWARGGWGEDVGDGDGRDGEGVALWMDEPCGADVSGGQLAGGRLAGGQARELAL